MPDKSSKVFTKEHVNWLIPVFRAHWLSQFSHPGCFSKSHFTEAARKNCSICFYMRVVLVAGVGGRSVWTQPRILRGNCWRAIEAAPSDQAAVSMWHPAKTTGQQQNNTDQRWLPFYCKFWQLGHLAFAMWLERRLEENTFYFLHQIVDSFWSWEDEIPCNFVLVSPMMIIT